MALGIPLFAAFNGLRDEPVALVGSGPSVLTQVKELHDFKGPIMAIKGAHDFLLEHGIVPTWAVLIDPQTHIVKYFRHLRDDIIYLIASQVHPEVFEYFKDRQRVLCHMADSATRNCVPPGTHMIAGGSTSGLRGLTMAYLLGYRDVHLFGMDSCLASDKVSRKVHGREVVEPLREGKDRIDVIINGRTFWSDKAMAAQAYEYQMLIPQMPRLCITPHGDGLLQEIIKCRKRLGNLDSGGDLDRDPACSVPFMTEGEIEKMEVETNLQMEAA